MHVCLSLGFEGQYRGLAREDSGLERVRRDVYETLAYFRPRGDDEISPHWQGLSTTAAQGSRRVPLWVVAAATSALLTAAFFALRVFITNEGEAVAGEVAGPQPDGAGHHRTRQLRTAHRGGEGQSDHQLPIFTSRSHPRRTGAKRSKTAD